MTLITQRPSSKRDSVAEKSARWARRVSMDGPARLALSSAGHPIQWIVLLFIGLHSIVIHRPSGSSISGSLLRSAVSGAAAAAAAKLTLPADHHYAPLIHPVQSRAG